MEKEFQIMTSIENAARSLGMPVEVDRDVDIHAERQQFPVVLVRSGSVETSPPDGVGSQVWLRRWTMSPSVEIWTKGATREHRSAVFSQFISALESEFHDPRPQAGGNLRLLARGTLPDITRSVETLEGKPSVSVQVFTMTLTFDR